MSVGFYEVEKFNADGSVHIFTDAELRDQLETAHRRKFRVITSADTVSDPQQAVRRVSGEEFKSMSAADRLRHVLDFRSQFDFEAHLHRPLNEVEQERLAVGLAWMIEQAQLSEGAEAVDTILQAYPQVTQ